MLFDRAGVAQGSWVYYNTNARGVVGGDWELLEVLRGDGVRNGAVRAHSMTVVADAHAPRAVTRMTRDDWAASPSPATRAMRRVCAPGGDALGGLGYPAHDAPCAAKSFPVASAARLRSKMPRPWAHSTQRAQGIPESTLSRVHDSLFSSAQRTQRAPESSRRAAHRTQGGPCHALLYAATFSCPLHDKHVILCLL